MSPEVPSDPAAAAADSVSLVGFSSFPPSNSLSLSRSSLDSLHLFTFSFLLPAFILCVLFYFLWRRFLYRLVKAKFAAAANSGIRPKSLLAMEMGMAQNAAANEWRNEHENDNQNENSAESLSSSIDGITRYSDDSHSASASSSSSSSSSASASDIADFGLLYINLLEGSFPRSGSYFIVLSLGTQVFRTRLSAAHSNTPIWTQKCRLIVRPSQLDWPLTISVYSSRRQLIARAATQKLKFFTRNDNSGGGNVRNYWMELDSAVAVKTAEANRKSPREFNETDLVDSESNNNSIQNTENLDDSASLLFSPSDSLISDCAVFPAVAADSAESLNSSIEAEEFNENQENQSLLKNSPNQANDNSDSSNAVSPSVSSSVSSLSRGFFSRFLPPFAARFSSAAASNSHRLHIERLFVPIQHPRMGIDCWRQICSIYDLTNQSHLTYPQLIQLFDCFANFPSADKGILLAESEHSAVPINEIALKIAEIERNHWNSYLKQKNSSSSSFPAVADYELRGRFCLIKCPLCLLDFRSNFIHFDVRDIRVHIRLCLENVADPAAGASNSVGAIGEFADSGFVSESLAVESLSNSKTNRILHSEGFEIGLFRHLSVQKHNFLVQDRSTGRLVEEKVPIVLKWFLRILYQSYVGQLSSANINLNLFQRMTEAMGRKYDQPASAARIPSFISYYSIDMSEFEGENLSFYKTFNEFFYRKLRPGKRKITARHDNSIVISPADCRLTVFSSVSEATEIWIKGKSFSLKSLLVFDELVSEWPDCALVLCRLAPADYHRFHSPIDCTLGELIEYQGGYASVNPLVIRSPQNVLTENRRTLTPLKSAGFPDVLFIPVGATMVGSVVHTAKSGEKLAKGDEIGYFSFGGSTVLLLFRSGSIEFDADLVNNSRKRMETLVQMGQSIGKRK